MLYRILGLGRRRPLSIFRFIVFTEFWVIFVRSFCILIEDIRLSYFLNASFIGKISNYLLLPDRIRHCCKEFPTPDFSYPTSVEGDYLKLQLSPGSYQRNVWIVCDGDVKILSSQKTVKTSRKLCQSILKFISDHYSKLSDWHVTVCFQYGHRFIIQRLASEMSHIITCILSLIKKFSKVAGIKVYFC